MRVREPPLCGVCCCSRTAQVGGELFVSGSYRLGVQRKGGDIDIAVVAPARYLFPPCSTPARDFPAG